MFDRTLALNGIADVIEVFVVDKPLEAESFGEAFDLPFAMLEGAALQIACHAGIENAVALIGDEIDRAAGHSGI